MSFESRPHLNFQKLPVLLKCVIFVNEFSYYKVSAICLSVH